MFNASVLGLDISNISIDTKPSNRLLGILSSRRGRLSSRRRCLKLLLNYIGKNLLL